jgi:hypothetical protein
MRVVENQFEAAVPADEPMAARRFACETADYCIEVRVESRREAAGGRVIGKITNRGISPQQPAQDLGVCLLNGKSPIVAAFTNHAGEFQLEFENAHCLCVSVSRDELDEVVLPLFGIQANPQDKTRV